MNRTELYNEVAREFGYGDVADSPPAAITNRIYGYLNRRHQMLCSLPGAAILRRETGPALTMTASSPTLALPMPVQRVLSVRNTTQDMTLQARDLYWYRRMEPDASTTSGTPEFYVPLRWSPALRDVGGTGLWAVSSSTADTTQTVRIEAIMTDGAQFQGGTTLNGTTRVQVTSITTYERLTRFSMSAAGDGAISLYDAASGGNVVSKILFGRTQAQFLVLALWPTPVAADTVVVDYLHLLRDFGAAYDEPQLPPEFHWLVSVGAKIDEGLKKEDLGRVREWEKQWNEGRQALVHFLAGSDGDNVVVPGELSELGRSNLGGAYPDGVW